MARQALIVSAFLLFLNVSLVLCREDYQQYYSNHYSHHHHKSTPADSVSSTEAPVSLSEETSVSGSANDIEVKTTDEDVKQHEFSLFGLSSDVKGSEKPVLQRYYEIDTSSDFDYETANQIRIVSIVVSLVLCVIGLIIIFCCGKKIGRKVQTGYIVNSGGAHPAQPGFAVSQSPAYSPQGVELRKVP